ncbi:type II toxin-antitoxin system RelE/ParE family toxin [Nostoc sp. CHAB 5715]|uniref:type II toxin-antitoxin system RelE/ParE family toxin n=1 Tax=Nostoc sp. CHAB 5715 TaxID=2780400 RepID=UPI001E44A80A|nr:type II toxin-antitoxin system RelE/ParE family toxin [Nostoc sp. CHAB 5715]
MTNPKLYILSPQAENDLARIYAYIARDNPDAAERILDKLLSACELLTDNPAIGQYRYDLTLLPVRFWLVQPRYFLIYRGENPIEIVRVLAANMDIARELAGE